MRYREPFRLFPKKLKSGTTIYYYTTYDILNRRKQYSTGQTKKSLAYRYCMELFKHDELLQVNKTKFSEYTKDWFEYDKCPYIQSLLIRGKTFSKSNAIQFRSRLLKSLIPFFGNLYLTDIQSKHVELWIIELKKKNLSNTTINMYIADLRKILNYAFSKGDIDKQPLSGFKLLKNNSAKRTTLTPTEVKRLFNKEKKSDIWVKDVYYIINYLACNTGMRIGELLALKYENVKKDHILVKYNFDRIYGLKTTKSGKSRIVPISNDTYNLIFKLKKESSSDFVFCNKSKPFTHNNILKHLKIALGNIGISDQERKTRNITFHSWRHYFNTKLIKEGVPLPIVQAIIGHSSNAMTENYTKLSKDDLLNATLNKKN